MQSITERWKSRTKEATRTILHRPWEFALSLLNPSVPLADVQRDMRRESSRPPTLVNASLRAARDGVERKRDTVASSGTKWPQCSRSNGRVGYRFVARECLPWVTNTRARCASCASRVHRRLESRRIAHARDSESSVQARNAASNRCVHACMRACVRRAAKDRSSWSSARHGDGRIANGEARVFPSRGWK